MNPTAAPVVGQIVIELTADMQVRVKAQYPSWAAMLMRPCS